MLLTAQCKIETPRRKCDAITPRTIGNFSFFACDELSKNLFQRLSSSNYRLIHATFTLGRTCRLLLWTKPVQNLSAYRISRINKN